MTSVPTPPSPPPSPPARAPSKSCTIDIVVPVYNEEQILESSITRLRDHLEEGFPFWWRIVIADNASTDATADIGRRLAASALHCCISMRRAVDERCVPPGADLTPTWCRTPTSTSRPA
jgi:hypothetical protein